MMNTAAHNTGASARHRMGNCTICKLMDLSVRATHHSPRLGDLCEGHFQAFKREIWWDAFKSYNETGS